MQRAETGDFDQPRLRAALFRDGLLIAFLAYRPIRRKNLASMVIGQHVRRVGDEWMVAFAAAETKGGRPLGFSFPAGLVSALQTYLDVYRPVLASRGCQGAMSSAKELWVSAHGTAMGASGIAHQVAAHTRDAFGTALSPHLFRDSAATSIAIDAPEQIQLVRPLLGHAMLATSERHYNLATSLDAGRRYSETVGEMRKLKSGSAARSA